MTEQIKETYDDVRDLIQTKSWELMDEEQRDNLMKEVVVPRWGKVTADGVTLKSTAWAKILGTTPRTIEARAHRIQAADQGKRSGPEGITKASRDHVRSGKAALKKHPDLWDDELLAEAEKALKRKEAVKAEVERIKHMLCEMVGDLEKTVEILADDEEEVKVSDFTDDFIEDQIKLLRGHLDDLEELTLGDE